MTKNYWARNALTVLLVTMAIGSGALICRGQATAAGHAAPPTNPQPPDYSREIRPLLGRCLTCHGPDEEARQAGLRLDRFEDATADRGGYRVIAPGDPDTSELIARVSADDMDLVMPPEGHGVRLTEAEIGLLRRWIEGGAGYRTHWAWVAPVRPELPDMDGPPWGAGEIDRFVLQAMREHGLEPNPPADRASLLRRAALELTGLPPALEDLDAFQRDSSPDAMARQVDRLLADPAFGERWASVWLDLARYADSQGYSSDHLREIWEWRDYVIRSFNANKPFDRFTIEQIAGDLLPDATDETRVATAFHRNTLTNTEGGTDDEEFRTAAVVDRVNTTFSVWMATTMACAQCHTHKYDPLAQEEYYRVFAIFNQTADRDLPDDAPRLALYSPQDAARRKQLEEAISDHQKAAVAPEQLAGLPLAARIPACLSRMKASLLQRELEAIAPRTSVPVMSELRPDQQRRTFVLVRGSFLNPGPEVTAGVPALFPPLAAGQPADRLALARWLVDRANPLTARVFVNRVWEQLFGRGLVETVEDFGTQGELPSHPELLDWLAVEFMDSGWDFKGLLRRILLSATWQQSGEASPEKLAADRPNRWLARGPRVRLTAEMVRDQALAVSGLLSRRMYGPPVHPPRPRLGLRTAFTDQTTDWDASAGEDCFRRAIYTEVRRSMPYPSMDTFDCPNREVAEVRRIPTNTPLQALVTLNDPVFVEAAHALGELMRQERTGRGSAAAVQWGFRRCLCRNPSEHESAVLESLLREAVEAFSLDPEGAARYLAGARSVPDGTQDANTLADRAAWSVVGSALLNLDEMFQKR